MIDHAEIHRMAKSVHVEERKVAVDHLSKNFINLPGEQKACAWDDVVRLANDIDINVQLSAVNALDLLFPNAPDKEHAWLSLHYLTQDDNWIIRCNVIRVLSSAFLHVPNQEKAWLDIVQLTKNNDSSIQWRAVIACLSVIPHVQNIQQAWEHLHRFSQDKNSEIRWRVAEAIGSIFSSIPNKDKNRAWEDLQNLAKDKVSEVRVYANHSLGRVSIFKATESLNEKLFKKNLEKAIGFFDKASKEAIRSNPARFCLPFYKSLYTITFKAESEVQEYLKSEALNHEPPSVPTPDTESEIQRYVDEAKSAIEGSENQKKLIEAVENLANALKEVQNARKLGFDTIRCNLNAYRHYCDSAASLLDDTKKQAPMATRAVKSVLPIINERIKEIIPEIKKNTEALCKQTQGTPFEHYGKEADQIGENLLKIRDSIGLIKNIDNLQMILSKICANFSEIDREDVCEVLKKLNKEVDIEDKLPLINIILAKISSQMNKIDRSPIPKKKGFIDLINAPATVASLIGFLAAEIGTYFYPITYNHLVSVFIAMFVFVIVAIFNKR